MSITFLPKAYFIGPHLKQVSKVFEPQHMFKSVRAKTKQMFHGSIINLGVIYEYTQHYVQMANNISGVNISDE